MKKMKVDNNYFFNIFKLQLLSLRVLKKIYLTKHNRNVDLSV